ncbi:MAG: carbamoyltransferase HypF [Nitrospirota bacterium]
MGPMADRAQILVKGIVQGVGFRPFVYNLAASLNLKGYVANTSEGVLIEIEGDRVADFVQKLKQEAPPLSSITHIAVTTLPFFGYPDFSIRTSLDQSQQPFTLISPDISICDDCLREMLDPDDRRYLYPFINCTNCGPRYSITTSIPYDRPNTTMASFTLCENCLHEYHDPGNRRFHAQPNACPVCGPKVQFRVPPIKAFEGRLDSESKIKSNNAMLVTIELLKQGGIVAIKGIGGFHIACDATNKEAVQRLRDRKRKSNKPFAIMVPSLEAAKRFCIASAQEQNLLQSARRPIVLLRKKEDSILPEAVSPHNQFVGIMLPYTPLHYLLFLHPDGKANRTKNPHFDALVMTSGNLSEEPIVHENEEAFKKLSSLVDGFLVHDRDIFMRVDDSVIRVQSSRFKVQSIKENNSELSFIRRSRGYAPNPIRLSSEGPEVMGCGADLKTVFTLTKGEFAIPSQHIGDMESYETKIFYEETLTNLKKVYRTNPLHLVHDLHPGYGTTKWAKEQAALSQSRDQTIQLYSIQHHYAHIGSVMAEYGLIDKVIGVVFDGTGYGTDGSLWGGEFLIADIEGFTRAAHIQHVPLPGGEAAIREPWKTALSYVVSAAENDVISQLEKIGFIERYGRSTIENLILVRKSSELSPLASGMGRLFDAVSAILGICDKNTFEGEAAIALESFTRAGIDEEYEVALKQENGYSVIDVGPMIRSIITDKERKYPIDRIATMFHNTIASLTRTMVNKLSTHYSLNQIVLSGGTFQNAYLLNRTMRQLTADGFAVYTNRQVPCNDACVSLGQAYLIRERLKQDLKLS